VEDLGLVGLWCADLDLVALAITSTFALFLWGGVNRVLGLEKEVVRGIVLAFMLISVDTASFLLSPSAFLLFSV
jgi:hypothetical protein